VERKRIKMNFEELIGTTIFICHRGQFSKEDQAGGFPAKLLGVEAGGIWIESEKHAAVFNEGLWAAELEELGPEGVGTARLDYFLPFSEVRLVVVPRARLDR
jgi:hypothetical protein